MTNRLLPILQPTHRPRLRQSYTPPLNDEAAHKKAVQSWLDNKPEVYEHIDDIPYGVFIMETGEEILFDSSYRPMWQRRGEGYPATRCDPKQYFEWFSVYWLWDQSITPHDSAHLRWILAIVVDEFCNGGPLYVRRWTPEQPEYAGMLIAKAAVKPKPSATVIPFHREKDDKQ
jgi:hypothetical protein